MRIERLKLEGFGHFRDFDLDLGPGLNLLHGQNEAGKSTLLAFIRFVLFEPDGRRQGPRYEAENAPVTGGSLVLGTDGGPLTVRRIRKGKVKTEVTIKDRFGAPLSPSRLIDLRHGMGRELFEQVFAFSLQELSTFEELAKERSVTDALFAAGMQGARRLPAVRKQLAQNAEALFRIRGKAELNAVLDALETVRSEIAALGDRPRAYFEQRDRLADQEALSRRLRDQLKNERRELERLQRLHRVAEPLAALARIRVELAELPEALASFPVDGVARLEDASGRRRRARTQLETATEELRALEAERNAATATLLPSEAVQAVDEAAEAFNARLALWRTLATRRAQVAARRRQVDADVRALGHGLAPERVLALDVGAAARSVLAGEAKVLHEAQRTHATRQEEVRAIETRLRDLHAEVQKRRDEQALLHQGDPAVLRQLVAEVGGAPALRSEVDRLRDEAAALRQEAQDLDAQQEPAPRPPPSVIWLVAAGVVGTALTLAAWRFGGKVAALGTGGVSVLLLLFVGLLLRHARAAYAGALAAVSARRERTEARKAGLLDRARRCDERLAALEVGLDELARRAGGTPGPELQARLSEQLRQCELRARLASELTSLEDRARRTEGDLQEARARMAEAQAQVEAARERIVSFLGARGLPETLSAEAASSLLTDISSLQEHLHAVESDEAALAVDEASCAEAISRLELALGKAGIRRDDPEAALAAARGVASAQAQTRQRIAGLDARIEALERTRKAAASEEALAAADVAALLERGGAEDEETFRARANAAERRAALLSEQRSNEAAVRAATGLDVAEAAAAVEAAGGAVALVAALHEVEARMTELAAKQEATDQEIGRLRQALEVLETDQTVATLRAQEEALVARAEALARAFAKERLGAVLLQRACKRYQDEQQPGIVRAASALFAELTSGRYRSVYVPPGDEMVLRVSDGWRDEIRPERLSRGTREQLYLAFRLAVIQDFTERRGPLPIVLDDILVNFDPVRAKNTVQVLARMAERQQILAFTCHPWMRDLFADHGAKVAELGGAKPLTLLPGVQGR